jgi:hypothetical protein
VFNLRHTETFNRIFKVSQKSAKAWRNVRDF